MLNSHYCKLTFVILRTLRGFTIKPVLIHVNGVQRSVVDSGYFTKIINFGEIFTLDEIPYNQDKGLVVENSAAV